MDEQRRLAVLLRQANDRVLYVSPPYAHADAREVFLSGYRTCLSDVAAGRLDVTAALGRRGSGG